MMSKSNHDDLADALARLAGGDVAPSEHEPPAPAAPPVPPAAAPAPRVTVRPASTRPAAPRPAAAAAPPAPPRTVRPAAPALSSAPPVPPAAPPASPAPVIRVVAPVVRKARPVAPTVAKVTPQQIAPSPAEVSGEQSTGLSAQAESSEIIDDDDTLSIPAPDASVFQPKPKPVNYAEARLKSAAKRNLELRRTLIPILLTCGVMMAVFATLKFVSGPDSMLAVVIPGWMPPVLGSLAVIVLGLAVVIMMSVKQQLDAMKK